MRRTRSDPEQRGRWVQVRWAELPEATFATELALEADDRDGLMLDIATVMTAARLRITAMTAKPAGGGTTFVSLNFPVHDLKELETVQGPAARDLRREGCPQRNG